MRIAPLHKHSLRTLRLPALLLLLCLMCACIVPPSQTHTSIKSNVPEITLTLALESEHPIAALLHDTAYKEALESTFGVRITLHEQSNLDLLQENVNFRFTGGLITDHSVSMVPLSNDNRLQQIEHSLPMQEPSYGRNGGRQFAYVFHQTHMSCDEM